MENTSVKNRIQTSEKKNEGAKQENNKLFDGYRFLSITTAFFTAKTGKQPPKLKTTKN